MRVLFVPKPGFHLNESSENLTQILRDVDEVFTTPRMAEECNEKVIVANAVTTQGKGYVQDLEDMVAFALDKGINVFITAGGDGTASYVASAALKLRRDGEPIRILGYPAGTENVGPIVHPLDRVKPSGIEGMREVLLDALEVSCGDKVLGYAFNDMIVGNTFLGTLDGKVVNLDAKALALEGRTVQARVSENIVTEGFTASLNGERVKVDQRFVQIGVSPLQTLPKTSHLIILGGMIYSIGYEHPATIAFLGRNLTDTDEGNWDLHCMTTTTHLCFKDGDELRLSGFTDEAQIIIDGNPFVREMDEITIRVRPDAVKALWSD